MFQKKHYEVIANTIRVVCERTPTDFEWPICNLVEEFIGVLKKDNPAFCKDKFYKAVCMGKCPYTLKKED